MGIPGCKSFLGYYRSGRAKNVALREMYKDYGIKDKKVKEQLCGVWEAFDKIKEEGDASKKQKAATNDGHSGTHA